MTVVSIRRGRCQSDGRFVLAWFAITPSNRWQFISTGVDRLKLAVVGAREALNCKTSCALKLPGCEVFKLQVMHDDKASLHLD